MNFVNEIKLYKSRKLLILKNIPTTSCFCCSKGAEEGKHPKSVNYKTSPIPTRQLSFHLQHPLLMPER